MFKGIKNIYNYREMLKSNIKKDIRGKYKGSFLGFLWTFINPLLQLIVYSLVFSQVMRIETKNYPMFIFTALIPWTFFTTSVQGSAWIVINNGPLLKKVYFPREILPISFITSSLVTFLFSMVIVFISLFVTGLGVTVYALYFPLIAVVNYLLVLGISFIVSSITVYLRDLENIINVFLMLMFYLTPILFDLSSFPEKYRGLLMLNPMAIIVTAYRDILYHQQSPQMLQLLAVALFGIILIILGYIAFKKLEKRFAEEL